MPNTDKEQPSFIIKTLGCKVNQYDSERLRSQLMRRGCQSLTGSGEEQPQLIVVNTCSVTSESDRKGRQLIRKMIRRYPNARIAVTGCYSERKPAELASIEGVDELVPIEEQAQWIERVVEELGWGCEDQDALWEPGQGIEIFQEHTRAFVKIQDGCDLKCTYCSIPASRGTARSRSLQEIVVEVEHLVRRGYPEIVLCGVCLGDYRRDEGDRLPDVVRAVAGIDGVKRLRISSLEPQHTTDELFAVMEAKREVVCPHLHLPLQSGSNRILRRMNRLYSVEFFQERIERARSVLPHFEISTDIMTGFPSETEADFQASLDAVRRIRFCKVHSFRFSVREDTPAARMKDRLPPPVIEARRKRLDETALSVAGEVKKAYIGQTLPVLTESGENGRYLGFTPNYLRAEFTSPRPVQAGEEVSVDMECMKEGRLAGAVCSSSLSD